MIEEHFGESSPFSLGVEEELMILDAVTFEQLRDAIARKQPGDTIKLEVVRNGSRKSVSVKLGQAPGG